MTTKKYKVSVVRIEHRIYQIEVEAENIEAAKGVAMDIWSDDDEAFTDMGCVHAEEDVHQVEEI